MQLLMQPWSDENFDGDIKEKEKNSEGVLPNISRIWNSFLLLFFLLTKVIFIIFVMYWVRAKRGVNKESLKTGSLFSLRVITSLVESAKSLSFSPQRQESSVGFAALSGQTREERNPRRDPTNVLAMQREPVLLAQRS